VRDFDLPWLHPYDVKVLGRGRYHLECIYALKCFWNNVLVEMKL
jgi:hypothetical protein